MDKDSRHLRGERAKAEDAAYNRMLCWLAGGCLLEFLLLLLNRYWVNYTVAELDFRSALDTAVKVMAVAALAGAVASAFWWNGTKGPALLPGALAVFALGLSAGCFAAWFFSAAGLKAMYICVPVAIVLALIYYLYPGEFFLLALQSALGLSGIWIASKSTGGSRAVLVYGCLSAAALLILAVAVVCRRAGNSGRALKLAGRQLLLFTQRPNYTLLYVGTILCLSALLLAVCGLSSTILYSVIVAWLLIMAVYYTVKLM